jgi:hypothetical protein
MSQLKVSDQYRTNALSLKPGGHTVTVTYVGGASFIYDKVKRPGMYIKSIDAKQEHGAIREIEIDGISVWNNSMKTNPWDI